jgi:60 kDa SS-A/Ro ribonucleoprotein
VGSNPPTVTITSTTMKINTYTPKPPVHTHGGAVASKITPEQELRRSVMACMLWEDSFYEDGKSIARRIAELVPKCRPEFVAACAFEARHVMHLRHVSLLLMREMARHVGHKTILKRLIPDVISRPDELSEFMAIYWKDGKQFISNPVRRGLAKAFEKFNEFSLAKYNGGTPAVKLRDVMFLTHPKHANEEVPVSHEFKERKYDNGGVGAVLRHNGVLHRLANNQLTTPDTWETALSAGADKKATFERLMKERALGGLAFLRNLRNMKESGVSRATVFEYSKTVNLRQVLPFRFIAAATAVPGWEDIVEGMFMRICAELPKLPGKTVVIVDVSGSMRSGKVSRKSDMTRLDAAGALAAVLRECSEECVLYATAGNDDTRKHATMEVPPRRGFGLISMFTTHQFQSAIGGGGIFLAQCTDFVGDLEKQKADRVIILTDEQDCDNKANPKSANAFGKRNYILNVSVEQSGIAYDKFMHINGWSDAVVNYIRISEDATSNQ